MLVLLLCECYKIADVKELKKVSESWADLVSSGLVSREEALRMTLVGILLPTLGDSRRAVPAKQLMGAADIDREELERQLQAVDTKGIPVEQVGGAGYRLRGGLDDLLVPEAVVPQLVERLSLAEILASVHARTSVLGLPYMYRPRHESTNRWLKSEAADLPSGTVAATDDQTQGRGRLGRDWSSEPGKDLTFSVLLRPSAVGCEADLLPLTAGLAVADVLEQLPGLRGRVRLKWPNDVLIDDRKVCGVLLESSSQGADLQWIVVGIGVNVNSDPVSRLEGLSESRREAWRGKPLPTSLLIESGERVGRGTLMVDLIARLTKRWLDTHIAGSLSELRSRDALLGRQVEVHSALPDGGSILTGEAMGIDDRGRLMVRGSDGTTTSVSAGEVRLGVDRLTT